MLKRMVLAIGLAASGIGATAAQAKDWLVERVSGTVWAMGPDRNPKRVQSKMTVPEGITITTAADGRVRLSSDNSVMTLAPNSVVAVSPSAPQSRTVNVMQKTGSVEFEVEKRAKPYFTVSSPYMAAVVKGTKFTIDVARKTTEIGVARGLVQVSDLRSGQTAAVGAGQGAQVSSAKAGLSTRGPVSPQVFQGKPQKPTVAPVGLDLSTFRAQAAQNHSPETSPVSRQGETEATAASSFSSGYSTGEALGSGGRTNSVGGSGNGSGHRGNAEAIGAGNSANSASGIGNGDRGPANGNAQGRTGQGRNDNGKRTGGRGPDGPGAGGRNENERGPGGKGSGGNGPKGPDGNGPGGPGPHRPGGNGKGNNGDGNGNGGAKGDDGKSDKGNGVGNNGGDDGSKGGGNGKGNNGDGNGNGGAKGDDGKAK